MSDETDHEREDTPCLLVVQDGCNPYLQYLRVACSSLAEATEVSSKINARFPMCPHGRHMSIEPIETADTLDDMFEEIVEHAQGQQAAFEEERHRRIMGFVANVNEGTMTASLDGQPIDAFQLSAMDNSDLARVEFRRTPKGDAKLREAGVQFVEFVRDENGNLVPRPMQPPTVEEPKAGDEEE